MNSVFFVAKNNPCDLARGGNLQDLRHGRKINFEATENTKEHKAFVNSVPFVAKSNWQLALAIGNIFTLTTQFVK